MWRVRHIDVAIASHRGEAIFLWLFDHESAADRDRFVTTADSSIPVPPSRTAARPREMARFVRVVGYAAVVLALSTGFASFLVLMGLTPVPPTERVVVWALIINGVLVSVLIGVIGWEVASLWTARRRGTAAARLHIRIVGLFAVVAVAPAILVAIVASITLDRGLDHWFSIRTRAIVDTSRQVAEAYLEEHAQAVGGDLMAMKMELERAASLFLDDRTRFQTFFNAVAGTRNLPAVFLIDSGGTTLLASSFNAEGDFPPVPAEALADADNPDGVPALIAPGTTNLVGGLIKLSGYNQVFLYAIRAIDPKVLGYVDLTQAGAAEYDNLEATRFQTQIAFALLYVGISLVVLLSAMWLGIAFANRLVSPIRKLIDAANQVARGDLVVEVPVRRSDGDIGSLGSSFNKMTAQLRSQRSELIAASDQIDGRRRFIEAVLSGVTAGVVGIDGDGRVTVVNRMALRLLGTTADTAIGAAFTGLAPELAGVVDAARSDGRREHRAQVTLLRAGRERTINVRVTTESSTSGDPGYVVTLDDITDLVTAQRSSAWADVARRIAHEIKNPLTPIQLSAERLKRKFGRVITDDREVFDQCTDTIIRQVGDIGRMVDEFSSFARMPKPSFEASDLKDAIRDAVFLIQVAHPEMRFTVDLPSEPLSGRFDSRLLSQAFTNLVKNASEAVAATGIEGGHISVEARSTPEAIVVDVTDNGVGLPAEHRDRLLEPYMTTREKGTGLGLAIVRKIVEEHGGRIELLDAPSVARGGRGALVRLTFPRRPAADPATADADPVLQPVS